jgi:hypothetical protein
MEGKAKKMAFPRAVSVDGFINSIPVPPSPIIYVKLLLFGECKSTIPVPENMTKDDLRRRASQEFRGRVAIQPDMLPPDTEEEDGRSIPPSEVITQTDEFGADEEHLPSFGTQAVVYDLNKEEAEELAEERERGIRHF